MRARDSERAQEAFERYVAPLVGKRNERNVVKRDIGSYRRRLAKARDVILSNRGGIIGTKTNHALSSVVGSLNELGVDYFLVHNAAAFALGLSYDVFIHTIDICLVGNACAGDRAGHGRFFSCAVAEVPVRAWSLESLGLDGDARTVRSPFYCCDVLAPDLLVDVMGLSPDIRRLLETRALVAAVVYVDELTDGQLEVVRRHVRGL